MVVSVRELMDNLLDARAVVRASRRKEFGAEMEVRRALTTCLQRTKHIKVPPADICLGHWECPASPIEACVYDDHTDPANDHCLYCNQPHERKFGLPDYLYF